MRDKYFFYLIVIIIFFLLISILGCSGTKYSEDYNEDNFKTITIGMNENEVTSLLGEPLEKIKEQSLVYSVKQMSGEYVDVVITYKGDNVISADSEIAKKRAITESMTRQDAESCLHTTESKPIGEPIWHYTYTKPKGIVGNYYSRSVVIKENKVIEIIMYDVLDD